LFVVQESSDIGDRFYCSAFRCENGQTKLVDFNINDKLLKTIVLFGVPNVVNMENFFYFVTGKEVDLEGDAQFVISKYRLASGGFLVLLGNCKKAEDELVVEVRRQNRVSRRVCEKEMVF
jgi:hypothetical protein